MKTTQITPDQRAMLDALDSMPDKDINYQDIPSRDATWWTGRGRLYKPVKVQKTLRIDADILAWFESVGAGYQTRINGALREYMEGQQNKRRRAPAK